MEFEKIVVSKPVITCEKQNIDIWIREKGKYAIIIENKVHNAVDQYKQLERYIDQTLLEGFNEQQIFVLYLPPTNFKEPTDESWGKHKADFYDSRYIRLSFKDDILEWLSGKQFTAFNTKNKYLKPAILHYIDHLNGLFNLRKEEENMNKELEKFIEEKLNNERDSKSSLEVIDATLEDIKVLNNQLYRLKRNKQVELLEDWLKKLKDHFKNDDFKLVKDESYPNKLNIELNIELKDGISLCCSIESVEGEDKPYFGLRKKIEETNNKELIDEMIQKLADNYFPSFDRSATDWYLWDYSDYSNGYEEFLSFITNLIKINNYD